MRKNSIPPAGRNHQDAAPPVETNYKPVVAVIFAVISMPFALGEVATGLVSPVTEQPSIPPVMGFGTAGRYGGSSTGKAVMPNTSSDT